MAKKRKKINKSGLAFVGFMLFVGAIALCAFLKTDEGKNLNTMSIDELKRQMDELIQAEQYEKAAIIRDLIKQKQSA